MEALNKVARITLIFWFMKIIATTLGETLGDHFSMTLNYGYSMILIATAIIFLGTLAVQINLKTYVPAVYWLVIIATTTLGTEISDYIDRSLHLGYMGGSILLLCCLAITLFAWYRKYGNLSVYPIYGKQKEIYYWTAILFSNSLGTALGDFLSDVIGLSYLQGAMVTALVIIIMALLHYFSKLNTVLLFWMAFIFTRPFGATFGDFLTKPVSNGGLNLGTLNASLVSVGLIIMFIFVSHYNYEKKKL